MTTRSDDARGADERIVITYTVTDADPSAVAEAIRVEQTIEFPIELAPVWIQETVVGNVESMDGDTVVISYDSRTVGGDLVQLLNLLWGNVSLFPGVRVKDVSLPSSITGMVRGPRFGVQGLREMLDAPARPIVTTALKPMGLSAAELAADAAILATAGFDLIKDDHGLANQPWAPWLERVQRVSAAVVDAAEQAGTKSRYMPVLNVPTDRIHDAAQAAKAAGAAALLVLPGISGFDAMRTLAADDELALPIMSHPSFLGSHMVNRTQGIDHGILLGTVMRLAGADISVFPNLGGRFSFSAAECIDIRDRCASDLGGLATIFPSPGGGMSLERIPEMVDFYGRDVALLIGGALHHGDLRTNAEAMMSAVRAY